MGALKDIVRDPATDRLRKAHAARAADASKKGVQKKVTMRVSPDVAEQVRVALKYMRAKRLAAHKGEVRTKALSEAELRKSGLGHLADLGNALGLKNT